MASKRRAGRKLWRNVDLDLPDIFFHAKESANPKNIESIETIERLRDRSTGAYLLQPWTPICCPSRSSIHCHADNNSAATAERTCSKKQKLVVLFSFVTLTRFGAAWVSCLTGLRLRNRSFHRCGEDWVSVCGELDIGSGWCRQIVSFLF